MFVFIIIYYIKFGFGLYYGFILVLIILVLYLYIVWLCIFMRYFLILFVNLDIWFNKKYFFFLKLICENKMKK